MRVRETGVGEVPSRTITGYAILFNTPSDPLESYADEEIREVISAGAITREFLDGCDIKMTMFHDRTTILARSKNGAGTLAYEVDDKGVKFSFDAPNTVDGDKALELVKRGDISGCSFSFSTRYYDDAYVSRSVERVGGKTVTTFTVNAIIKIWDFTLAADPAYSDTSCEVRELLSDLRTDDAEQLAIGDKVREQVREMREAAAQLLR